MTCDGEAHWYLSVKYTKEPSGAVSASQELYINKILKRWGMEPCKPLPIPFPAKSDVVLDKILKPIENPDPVLNKQFQEIIGQLLYCQQKTVPEISWSVSIPARFTTKAGAPHIAFAKKVLRYLPGRTSIPLRWCARSCQQPHLPGHIYGYADASFANIKPDRLSSMGYVVIINNGAVSWRSTRIPLVTLRAAESEVIDIFASPRPAIPFCRNILFGIPCWDAPPALLLWLSGTPQIQTMMCHEMSSSLLHSLPHSCSSLS